MSLLAIDPGSERSAWLVYEPTWSPESVQPGPILDAAITSNDGLLDLLRAGIPGVDAAAIEYVSPRGLPTSVQDFETVWWGGRFAEALLVGDTSVERIKRDDVKYHLCGRRAKVNDTNVRAALIDRFGGIGGKAAAVGLKASPGPLYGIKADLWQALAVAVTWIDQEVA